MADSTKVDTLDIENYDIDFFKEALKNYDNNTKQDNEPEARSYVSKTGLQIAEEKYDSVFKSIRALDKETPNAKLSNIYDNAVAIEDIIMNEIPKDSPDGWDTQNYENQPMGYSRFRGMKLPSIDDPNAGNKFGELKPFDASVIRDIEIYLGDQEAFEADIPKSLTNKGSIGNQNDYHSWQEIRNELGIAIENALVKGVKTDPQTGEEVELGVTKPLLAGSVVNQAETHVLKFAKLLQDPNQLPVDLQGRDIDRGFFSLIPNTLQMGYNIFARDEFVASPEWDREHGRFVSTGEKKTPMFYGMSLGDKNTFMSMMDMIKDFDDPLINDLMEKYEDLIIPATDYVYQNQKIYVQMIQEYAHTRSSLMGDEDRKVGFAVLDQIVDKNMSHEDIVGQGTKGPGLHESVSSVFGIAPFTEDYVESRGHKQTETKYDAHEGAIDLDIIKDYGSFLEEFQLYQRERMAALKKVDELGGDWEETIGKE